MAGSCSPFLYELVTHFSHPFLNGEARRAVLEDRRGGGEAPVGSRALSLAVFAFLLLALCPPFEVEGGVSRLRFFFFFAAAEKKEGLEKKAEW